LITGVKKNAIAIIIHTLLTERVKNEKLIQIDDIYKLDDGKFNILNLELLELIKSISSSGLTKDLLDPYSGNINISRLTYYYSVGLSKIEKHIKNDINYSSLLLCVCLLTVIVEEKGLIKADTSPTALFSLYEKQKIPYDELIKVMDLSENIIKEITKSNFSKAILKSQRNKKKK